MTSATGLAFEALREAGTMVLYGVSGVLDSDAEYQVEMRYYADL